MAISTHQILVIGGVPHDDDIEAHRLIFLPLSSSGGDGLKHYFRVIEFDSRTGAWSIWGLLSVPYIG